MYNKFENQNNIFLTDNYRFPAGKSSADDPHGLSVQMIDRLIKKHDEKHTQKEQELEQSIAEIMANISDMRTDITKNSDNINAIKNYLARFKTFEVHESIVEEWGIFAFDGYGNRDFIVIENWHTKNTSGSIILSKQYTLNFVDDLLPGGFGNIAILFSPAGVQTVQSWTINVADNTITVDVQNGELFGSSSIFFTKSSQLDFPKSS